MKHSVQEGKKPACNAWSLHVPQDVYTTIDFNGYERVTTDLLTRCYLVVTWPDQFTGHGKRMTHAHLSNLYLSPDKAELDLNEYASFLREQALGGNALVVGGSTGHSEELLENIESILAQADLNVQYTHTLTPFAHETILTPRRVEIHDLQGYRQADGTHTFLQMEYTRFNLRTNTVEER